jgi:formylglycine-generating enzyme required for sulfatase activity
MRTIALSLAIFSIFLAQHSTFFSISDVKQPSSSQKTQAPAKPGKTFRDCQDCPEMMEIPAGSFMMGAPASEPGRDAIEGPQRRVSIRSFAAGKFDVTRGQWAAFVSATRRPTTEGCDYSGFEKKEDQAKASWSHLGFPQDDTHPVVCVTFADAQDYVRWLSAKTGKKYRLLSEAEWEYAARAGTSTTYPWVRARAIKMPITARIRDWRRAAITGTTRPRWALFLRMPSACTICTATCCKPCRIV